ncbi:MAG: class I SAM-dependent methyltransferase [Deltaproteobacteria bacterium]|nr:class I SAM-dependent methyltransferase [Deltaproteobacteria bacterium]MBW2395759.1 class I SAM-dependent methyltransferase [Deltaproteobacteria bacterium]
MSEAPRSFIPAAGHDWLLPLYDPLLRLMGVDRIRAALIDEAAPQPGDRVLDLGCGTGSLAIQLLAACPEARVCGMDPDPKALGRARRKAVQAGVELEWREGFADALPFEDGSFDCVVSSLVFHHLAPNTVRAVVPEVRRVLRPGGTLNVLDFGAAGHGIHGLLSHLASHQHGDEDVAGELPELMEKAGLVEVESRPTRRTLLGEVFLTTGKLPDQAA